MTIRLTAAQERFLDETVPEVKVVGSDNGRLVLRWPHGNASVVELDGTNRFWTDQPQLSDDEGLLLALLVAVTDFAEAQWDRINVRLREVGYEVRDGVLVDAMEADRPKT